MHPAPSAPDRQESPEAILRQSQHEEQGEGGLFTFLYLAGWMCIWVLANMGCSIMSRYKPLPVLPDERDHMDAWKKQRARRYSREVERHFSAWMDARCQESKMNIFCLCGHAAYFGLTFTARIIHTRPWLSLIHI